MPTTPNIAEALLLSVIAVVHIANMDEGGKALDLVMRELQKHSLTPVIT
jgi:hypothetical protein